MKITSIRAHVLEAPIEDSFAFSQTWVDRRVGLAVEIQTDAGITGWGDGYGPPRLIASAIDHAYAPRLEGRDPLAGDAIWEDLYNGFRDHGQRGIMIQALSALDIALWDIRGKALNQPVHRLLGGPIRTRVRAYATGLYRRSDDQRENHALLRDEAEGYLAASFTAMKTKVGFGFADDIALIEMLRKTIGETELFVDANHGCDLVQAKRLCRAMEPLDIGWFEEPVEPEDLEAYAELRSFTSIPIAGGECSFTRHDFRRILEARAMDIIQPDTASCGGLTEAKRIADMAWTHGVRYQPHVWGTGIGLAAAMQLLAVLPTGAPGLGAHQPLLEYDSTPHPFRQGLLVDPVRVEQGIAHVPDGPGLGIEIRRDVLERWRVN